MRRILAAGAIVLLVGCGRGTVPTATGPSAIASPSPPAGPVNQVVTFDLTFTADNACTVLPSFARSRTYSTTAVAGSQVISLLGGTFGGSSEPGYPSLWNVIYQNPSDDADTWWFQDPEIWEHLSTESYLVIYGGPARIGSGGGYHEPANRRMAVLGQIHLLRGNGTGQLSGMRGPGDHLRIVTSHAHARSAVTDRPAEHGLFGQSFRR